MGWSDDGPAAHNHVPVADYVTTMPRAEQERKGKIRTATGRYVNPLALRPEDICIEDIAHHLANLCRYTGSCPEFYSVAQHSVLVSEVLAGGTGRVGAILELAGLLHDASEAYLNDLASPVKHDPLLNGYRGIEASAERMIFEVFGLDPALLPLTKAADDIVFKRETASWWAADTLKRCERIQPWTPGIARVQFLSRFDRLQERLYGRS